MRLRNFAAFLVGTILVQAAWILALPAFRGIDEFDHVYKAAAVARGQWTAPDPAPHGRGGIVTIPASIVRAASPVCRRYRYTGHDNCYPIRTVGRDQAEVATAAGAYNPAYYVIVGTLARPFGGAASDFAMRVVTALICALFVGWAAAVVSRWATTSWPLVTLTIGLTPVLVYSTSVAAPNGITYTSAALLWAGLIGLVRAGAGAREFALPLTVASVAMVATHTTGVMWLLLAVATVVGLRPLREWALLLRRHASIWATAAGVVLVAVVLCQAWARFAHTNSLGSTPVESGSLPLRKLALVHVLWTLQSIAAFPMRDEHAPAVVYAIWGVALFGALIALFRLGARRERLAGILALVLLIAVPTILTAVSFRTQSFAWQGRYSLPLWLGLTSLSGLVLDKSKRRPSPRVILILYAALATAMAISATHVGLQEIAQGAVKPVIADVPGGMALVGLLAVVGSLTPLSVVSIRRNGPRSLFRKLPPFDDRVSSAAAITDKGHR